MYLIKINYKTLKKLKNQKVIANKEFFINMIIFLCLWLLSNNYFNLKFFS